MMSNLLNQMKQQGKADKYPALIEEMPRVRAEVGYPPLVTPTSQIIGATAAFNVICGRYKVVSQEIKDLARGAYGRTPAPILDELRKVIGNMEIIEHRPADDIPPQMEVLTDRLAEGRLSRRVDGRRLVLRPVPGRGAQVLRGQSGQATAGICLGDLAGPRAAPLRRPRSVRGSEAAHRRAARRQFALMPAAFTRAALASISLRTWASNSRGVIGIGSAPIVRMRSRIAGVCSAAMIS